MSGYKPIESYGVIGNLYSVALVAMDGSIGWCCLPNFDSPSIFAAILDSQKGGFFKVSATDEGARRQMYLPETNVLLTRFLNAEGVAEVVDFMPVRPRGSESSPRAFHQIVRIVRSIRGSNRFQLVCRPAFDFARKPHEVRVEARGAVFEARGSKLVLLSPVTLRASEGGVEAEFALAAGESS